jgi:hypothetical protein
MAATIKLWTAIATSILMAGCGEVRLTYTRDPVTGVVNVEYIRPAMADVKIGEISVTKNVDTGALDVRVSDYSFQEKLTQALEHAVQAITTLAGSAPTSP